MKVASRTFEIWPGLDCTVHTAHLGFDDYSKIVGYLRWRKPVGFEPYYGIYLLEGIAATYDDGTKEKFSFLKLRDLLDSRWFHLKRLLDSPEENLDQYTEESRVGMCGETLTLKCSRLCFKTGDRKGVAFDRIWGNVKNEYTE